MNNTEPTPQEKARGSTLLHIIDWTLLLILLAWVVYAQIDGKFISKEVYRVETCNGNIISVNGLNINQSTFNWSDLLVEQDNNETQKAATGDS